MKSFTSDGTLLVVEGFYDREIMIWDLVNWKAVPFETPFKGQWDYLSFSSYGKRLMAVDTMNDDFIYLSVTGPNNSAALAIYPLRSGTATTTRLPEGTLGTLA